jgi:uncharacterized protein (DUF2236 family)
MGVVHDSPAAETTAGKVRRNHQPIHRPAKYHALAPCTVYRAHAVFLMTTVRFDDRFMGGVSAADREKVFEEHVQWVPGFTA